MARQNLFKKGNQQWQRRSKHGPDKTFKSPALLLQAFNDYYVWNNENPLKEQKAMVTSNGTGAGSDIEYAELNKMRAMTIIGFCLFCGVNSEYWRTFKHQLKENSVNTPALLSDYNSVIKFIEDAIYTQKFEGASAGLLNANLISRDLGLADKMITENTNYNSVPMTKEEIKALGDQLEQDV